MYSGSVFYHDVSMFTGSLSQPVLTQPPSASASVGQTAKLTCTLSSGYNSYVVNWFQQSPGKSPRFVMHVGSSGIVGSKGDGIPDHFSGSGSGLDRYLTIQNTQEEDENVYYCGASHGSGSSFM
ncbi:Ig lambda chain V-1 region-like [Marmota monax]|uniref:Ig lambda chain V-1 region-like n=1 Tax=Marmota monax TaxID=9995 RepID=A0A834QDH0_MARMO|nr:Ig lambda chain V-1 region-like [Marmota monax]